MGVKPQHAGLEINPCIPKAWDGFTAVRKFRNSIYDITVKNPNHVSKGVVSMYVDGKKIKGNIIPIFDDHQKHTVEIIMG